MSLEALSIQPWMMASRPSEKRASMNLKYSLEFYSPKRSIICMRSASFYCATSAESFFTTATSASTFGSSFLI